MHINAVLQYRLRECFKTLPKIRYWELARKEHVYKARLSADLRSFVKILADKLRENHCLFFLPLIGAHSNKANILNHSFNSCQSNASNRDLPKILF